MPHGVKYGGFMRRITALLVFCLSFSVLAYAATKYKMTNTTSAPAARGQAEVSIDKKNGNTKVQIKVKYLASPENLASPKSMYLVWYQESGGNPESQGRLRIGKNLDGSFENTTVFKNFDIWITAESEAAIKRPAGQEVLRTTVRH
jgi:hypothetical protein